MTIATHMHTFNRERLLKLNNTDRPDGLTTFRNLDCPYPCFTTCPETPDFVIPFADRSSIISAPVNNVIPINRAQGGFHGKATS